MSSRAAAAALLLAGITLHAQQQTRRPEFRAGTDIVTLDVVVLDKNRKPVRGLTAADFVVTESRDRQEIVSFAEVTVPPPDMALASWQREIGSDVVTNDVVGRRLVAILMDDANASLGVLDHGATLARRTGHAIVDQLGPQDLGAVVYTFLGRFENFTDDKQRLHKAVDDFVPRYHKDSPAAAGPPLGCALRLPGISPGLGRGTRGDMNGLGCQVNSLTRMAEVLLTAPPGRKMVAFVSPGMKLEPNTIDNPDQLAGIPWLKTMFELLQQANATVYQFDPAGLTGKLDLRAEVSISTATGGRDIKNTNAPDRIVPAVFEENSAYYLVGYRSTHIRTDGLYRKVNVKASRPDLDVVTRSGYYGPSKPKSSTKLAPKPVDAALASGMLATDLRLGVNVAAFAVPGRREADVAATIVVTDPMGTEAGAPETHNVELVSVAYDTGWRSTFSYRQTIAVTRVPGVDDPAKYELTTRLSLKPGRYELRFAADSGGRTGSIYTSLDVPNFAKDSLSLSGLLMEKAPQARTPTGASLANLVPIVPTSNRRFVPQDRPTVFLRVYEGGTKPFVAIAMKAEVKDSHDRVVWTESSLVAPSDFSAARSADYRVALPVARLAPGEHLLTVTASRDAEDRLERTVRFHVE